MPTINPSRFHSDFQSLAQIGATPEGGVHRPTFSAAHLQARLWLTDRIRESGLELRIDDAGNHSAYLECAGPGAPVLLLGSHLDSVPYGGRFDGALGVLAALEALRVVAESGLRLNANLEAIDFTDEEGTLFGLLGSSALAGHLRPEDLINPRGGRQALLDGLAAAGLTEQGLLQARRDPSTLAGYLELHIEQGPRLVQARAQIGVVTGIVGIGSYRLAFTGRADHAGTTPMENRLDAAQGAASFILAARRLVVGGDSHSRFSGCMVNTGDLRLEPGAFNIVPARAVLALEFRSADAGQMAQLEATLLEQARLAADEFGLGLQVERLGLHPPAFMDHRMQESILRAAAGLGLTHLRLSSGAGHDAQSLAPLCPSGMIFVPSVDGASHSPREFTEWQDCLNGANLLLKAAVDFGSRRVKSPDWGIEE